MLRIRVLLWDEWNEQHIARHNVEPEEVEEVAFGRVSLAVKIRRGRYRITGQAESGRYLTIFVDRVDSEVFYPVTARDSTDSETWRLRRWRGD